VTGTILPLEEIGKLTKKKNILFFVDAAQSVPHMPVDFKKLNCEAFVFSAHKMYGPTGLGAIVSTKAFLEKLKALHFGGSMIDQVDLHESSYAEVPYSFEAGTPNISDVIAFGATLEYLKELDMQKVEEYEQELVKTFLEEAKEMKTMRLIGPKESEKRAAVFSFVLEGLHANDLAMLLDKKGFALRSGHHCAMPLGKERGALSSLRASLSFYNTEEEIRELFKVLKEFEKRFAKS
jgi:cysteine desulfurase/selenocysteine lyase